METRRARMAETTYGRTNQGRFAVCSHVCVVWYCRCRHRMAFTNHSTMTCKTHPIGTNSRRVLNPSIRYGFLCIIRRTKRCTEPPAAFCLVPWSFSFIRQFSAVGEL